MIDTTTGLGDSTVPLERWPVAAHQRGISCEERGLVVPWSRWISSRSHVFASCAPRIAHADATPENTMEQV